MGRAAVGQIVAGDGGDDHVLEAKFMGGLAHASGLVQVQRPGLARRDVAKGAVAGADMAHNQKRGRTLGIALEHIRAFGVAADRVQTEIFDQAVGAGKAGLEGSLVRSHGGMRKYGTEFSGADMFDLLHGYGFVILKFAVQRRGFGVGQAAEGDQPEQGQVAAHVQGQSVVRGPAPHRCRWTRFCATRSTRRDGPPIVRRSGRNAAGCG